MSVPSFNVERQFTIQVGMNRPMAWELVNILDAKEKDEGELSTYLFAFRENLLRVLPVVEEKEKEKEAVS